MYTCNPSAEAVETGGSLRLSGQPVSSKFSEGPCHETQGEEAIEEDTKD